MPSTKVYNTEANCSGAVTLHSPDLLTVEVPVSDKTDCKKFRQFCTNMPHRLVLNMANALLKFLSDGRESWGYDITYEVRDEAYMVTVARQPGQPNMAFHQAHIPAHLVLGAY